MNIRSTDLARHPGVALDTAAKEPVFIEKFGRPFAVLVSHEFFKNLEDSYWGKLDLEAEKDEDMMTEEETMAFLRGETVVE